MLWLLLGVGLATAAVVVPTDIQQPGTQSGEVSNLESPDKCDNCHGGYNQAVEPAFNWRGSMMANAGRDPIFWATLAVAEQDFDGAGDLCIRCHSTGGWYAGRSTPTDGSGLMAGDSDGVECDACHKMTNTDTSEILGVMVSPFVANDEQSPPTGYYGSGMEALYGGAAKLGPYSDAGAKHQFLQSRFHRDVKFCGTCHDVSNPAVGDLAQDNGRQSTADPVMASGIPGSPVDGKAAFNNFPYQYGIVERTFSEYMSGGLSKALVSSYPTLPVDLQTGAIKAAYDSAKGNYADGVNRYFSCQTCHLPAVTGYGANKPGIPLRTDLPLHDMTGGNTWAPDAVLSQNTAGTLRLGGGLNATQIAAIQAGKLRAERQLQLAAAMSVTGDTLRITNLTAHKLISGYPEGRRMWVNIKWYDASNTMLREDGKYDVVASVNGSPVKSIVDLHDPNTKVYEAHYGMTQEWAHQLVSLGYASTLALSYDRVSGAPSYTLGQLAAQAAGTSHETFHFVLNDTVAQDNRIPPYGFTYNEARQRNALPVPAEQYGNPGAGGTYQYSDEVGLHPPAGATHATINLLYQSTSWEYVQFLYKANNGQNAFLANEGVNLLNAWLATGMGEPVVMASATWTGAPQPPTVAGRWIFYNNASWDHNNTAANADDDLAIATDKTALLPGGTATFANYTSYPKGINGVMIDVSGVAAGQDPAATDFVCTMGNDNTPGGWAAAPAPAVSIRRGQGLEGSDRITLLWNDNAIEGKWLRVQMVASATKNLPADVFYVGNAPGEVGHDPTSARVNGVDELLIRAHRAASAPVTDRYDVNRDGVVDIGDEMVARTHVTWAGNELRLIAPP